MIAILSGTVISLEEGGFKVRGASGSECLVSTLLPGREINLVVGDVVSVTGGSGGPGIWLSSSCYKDLPNGKSVPVRINPHDPPDKLAVRAGGLWSRIKRLFGS